MGAPGSAAATAAAAGATRQLLPSAAPAIAGLPSSLWADDGNMLLLLNEEARPKLTE